MKRALLLASALVLLVFATACDELGDQTAAEAALPAVAIGEPASAGADGWTITVTRVSRIATIDVGGTTKTALGTYLVVEFTMENTSDQRQALGGNRFKLADSQGRNFDWYEAGTNAYGKQELGSRINPGLSAPATIIFDVLPDATGLVFRSLGNVRIALGDVAAIP
jgi:hypothetical protein